MRKMKKFASLMLALVMVLALAAPAFASSGTNDDSGTITINNAVAGQSYSIYQLFKLESYNTTAETYAYTYDRGTQDNSNPWNAFILTGDGNQYVSVDAQGYVTWVENANAAEFAKLALAYAKDNSIAAKETKIAESTTVEFENLNLGYYLVDSSLGALCSLNTTNPNADIREKNSKPDVDKEVQEDSAITNNNPSTGYQHANDAQIGDTVNFKTTVTVGAGAVNYVLHDKMDAGLTWNNTVKVTLNGAEVSADNYTLTSFNLADGCTFEIEFHDNYMAQRSQGEKLIVEYSAILNDKAVVYPSPNKNTTHLEYGDGTDVTNKTDDKETKTYTYEFDLVKTDSETGNRLAGAKFELYDAQTKGNKIQLVEVKQDAEGNALSNTYRIATKEEIADSSVTKVTEFEVPVEDDQHVTIIGLDARESYWLEETVAPAGYNKLSGRVEVQIDAKFNENKTDIGEYTGLANTTKGTETKGEGENTVTITTWAQCVEVKNSHGSLLPETGGIGTTIFYVVGGVLIAAAGVLLITKKRVNA